MSEPAQLIVKVRLSLPRYDAYLASAPPPATDRLPWQEWLAQHEYYGPPITDEQIGRMCVYREKTVGEFLAGLAVDHEHPALAFSQHEPAASEWTMLVTEFSENFGDYIRALNVLHHLASFKDVPEDGYAAIIQRVWERSEKPMALLKIGVGEATLVAPDDAAAGPFVAWAEDLIDTRIEGLQ